MIILFALSNTLNYLCMFCIKGKELLFFHKSAVLNIRLKDSKGTFKPLPPPPKRKAKLLRRE